MPDTTCPVSCSGSPVPDSDNGVKPVRTAPLKTDCCSRRSTKLGRDVPPKNCGASSRISLVPIVTTVGLFYAVHLTVFFYVLLVLRQLFARTLERAQIIRDRLKIILRAERPRHLHHVPQHVVKGIKISIEFESRRHVFGLRA